MEVLATLPSFILAHERALWLVGLVSVAMAIASMVLLPVLIVRLPADYFVADRDGAIDRPRGAAVLLLALLRNALGALLLVAGVLMLFLPGQGLLTILVAVALLDFPGKRTLERRLVSRPGVLRAANRLRAWRGRPPLRVPAGGDS